MTMLTAFTNLAAMVAITGIENIIIVSREENGYDDSDFYYVGVNIKSGEYFKHYHSTTRGAGHNPLDNAAFIGSLSDTLQATVREMFKSSCVAEANRLLSTDLDRWIDVGDTVKVSNPRARKFKGVEFVVTGFDDFIDGYGRRKTVYLLGDNGIKTNITNCTKINSGDKSIAALVDDLEVGFNYNKYRKY